MAGISVRRIFLPVFIVGALTSIAAYVFQEKVTVWTQREGVKVLKRIYLAPGSIPIQANVFFRAERYYFYVNRIERTGGNTTLTDLMIYEPPIGDGFPTLITAKSAMEEDHIWYLKECTIYCVADNGDPELIGHPKKMKLDLRRAVTDYFAQEQKVPEAMSIKELKGEMDKLCQSGQKSDSYQLEYGYKLAIPLSSLILLLCVAPLSLRFGRGGGFMGVLIGIVVLFFYWNVILFSRVLGKTGGLPPGLAGWSEVIIFTILGIYLMWETE